MSTTEVLQVDPTTLLVDVNIRQYMKLDKDFLASVKELGVLVPITAVRTSTGDIRVRFGHRRTAAAIQAGLDSVPVEVIGDEGSDDAAAIERIITQHAENTHRAGLTAAEKVGVVTQLSAFGVKAGEIAKKTRIAKAEVEAAEAVAQSKTATAVAQKYDFVTLEQSAAVAEFENDKEAVKRLVKAAQDGQFDHTVSQLREDREEREAVAAKVAELEAEGVKLVDRPTWDSPVKSLRMFGTAKEPLNEEAHRDCPGHAAWVQSYYDYGHEQYDDETDEAIPDPDAPGWVVEVNYVCTDPKKYGHTSGIGGRPAPTAEDDEKAKAERQLVLANNKAWRAAEKVRRAWLGEFLKRKTPPQNALDYIAAEMFIGSFPLRDAYGTDSNSYALELLGLDAPRTVHSDSQAITALLAHVLSAFERSTGVHTWRHNYHAATAGRYFSQLAAWGYELSEIEQSVVDQANGGVKA